MHIFLYLCYTVVQREYITFVNADMLDLNDDSKKKLWAYSYIIHLRFRVELGISWYAFPIYFKQ
jgi:hypothetical protein